MPEHIEKYIGENDLFLEIYESKSHPEAIGKKPPLLFVHGAYTGSWMWSKYIPHFVGKGWKCYAMNMRSHYKSRVMDMTKITYRDYLDDIKEITDECGESPIVIGFSMGGILCQKLAETITFAGLVLIDTSISKEVYAIAPYTESCEIIAEIVEPAPAREEYFSIDESADDLAFQKKYLAMESSKARNAMFPFAAQGGISIDGSLITCPSLVIKAVNSDEDDRRGRATAEQLKAEYIGLYNKTHTGLLVGQRYREAVDGIMNWLRRF
ncbi:alpha/beta hydrolase family protein [Desulfosporosinus sp. PR]|uniref:alpha/beta hydrolase n=1 Tax=Candidatus Desulfosporosinus nitrosoreducens TaxID=3401928 RepID=UPI0027ECD0B0|nr:alpha/beta hydrolase family protein [Desulfosporosinus sp. PR]MDQ7094582.1 alpha/beta hydrolase family protein [Desulfosporosinus sp. PR]